MQTRTAMMSLHALLDYDEDDCEDETHWELCVFGECMTELLARDYGCVVAGALAEKQWVTCGCVLLEHRLL